MDIREHTQAAHSSSYNHAQVSILPAFGKLVYIIFGRVPEKFLGISALMISLTLLAVFGSQNYVIKNSLHRMDVFEVPFFTKTVFSPGSKKLRAVEVEEKTVLVQNIASVPVITPLEDLKFSGKINMFATSYDKNCPGCSGTTATGLPAGYGVVAVDPKVIPLGSKLFIPGYGTATAGDTGSAIKGNKIDLGFDDIKSGWWSSRFVDVYILK